MRSFRWFVAAAVVAPLVLLAPSRAGAKPDATLRPGAAAFWNAGTRRSFTIDVKRGGALLRVALTHPDFRRAAYGALYDPSGRQAGLLGGWMSGEAYIADPVAGRWSVRLTAASDYTEIRLRAKLERASSVPRKPVALLPNLRLVPPYEFTFSSLVSGGRGAYGAGGANPATSCTADDVAEQQGVRCLRFSVGPANVGNGPLELVFPPMEGLVVPGNAVQVVEWSDGHQTTRPAGQFQYHKTHAHYHHSGFGSLELLKVNDPATGAMQPVGTGPKQGFCTADVVIADWASFGGRQNSAYSTCEQNAGVVYDPTEGTRMGLSAGWADIYSWEQDGNYVEFGLNGDGRYVVRSTADALNSILESNESDNTAYAYLQVSGSTIKVLERGRGQGPWDKHKVVVHDGLHPNATV
jgi:hypothetical protein